MDAGSLQFEEERSRLITCLEALGESLDPDEYSPDQRMAVVVKLFQLDTLTRSVLEVRASGQPGSPIYLEALLQERRSWLKFLYSHSRDNAPWLKLVDIDLPGADLTATDMFELGIDNLEAFVNDQTNLVERDARIISMSELLEQSGYEMAQGDVEAIRLILAFHSLDKTVPVDQYFRQALSLHASYPADERWGRVKQYLEALG